MELEKDPAAVMRDQLAKVRGLLDEAMSEMGAMVDPLYWEMQTIDKDDDSDKAHARRQLLVRIRNYPHDMRERLTPVGMLLNDLELLLLVLPETR